MVTSTISLRHLSPPPFPRILAPGALRHGMPLILKKASPYAMIIEDVSRLFCDIVDWNNSRIYFLGQRYPITSVFLGGRSTVIPQTTGRSAWPLPDSYKKLFLFIVCVIAFSGCIALAMLIPKMHNRPCHPCRLLAFICYCKVVPIVLTGEIPAHTA